LLRYLVPHTAKILASALGSVVVAGCTAAYAFFVKFLFDYILVPQPMPPAGWPAKERYFRWLVERSGLSEAELLVAVPGLLVVLFVAKGAASYLSSVAMSLAGYSVATDIRNDLFRALHQQPVRFFQGQATGGLMSRFLSDIEKIQEGLARVCGDLLKEASTLIALGLYVVVLDWRLAAISLLIAPLIVIPIVQTGRSLKRTHQRSQERTGEIATLLHETIGGIRVVKAFGMEGFEVGRFIVATRRLMRSCVRAAKYEALVTPVMELIGGVGAAVMIFYGSFQIRSGTMTPGDFAAFLGALLLMYEPMKRLSGTGAKYQQALACAERVFELMNRRDEVREAPDARSLAPLQKSIEYRSVYFGYEDGLVLRNVDFEIKKGEVVALVGPSGSGKTTLINLLLRFYDVRTGAILIDGIDLRAATLASLRAQIGLVTQETVLFNDTVRNNIAYGRGDMPQDAIEAAARAAYAHEFITKLPAGYDTIVGERGARLSGGQRQRIAIARALLKDPPILILDEATSALDSESELVLQNAIANLLRDRTTLVIAHRLSTVRRADRIIVLQEGRVVEVGPHAELLRKRGAYARLYASQIVDLSGAAVSQ
jgi:subfamily B ATP-binding cassette protein MsbA